MASKIYTAQEMRAAADTMDEYIKEMEDGNSMYWRDDHITSEDWKAMLRQATEVVERCEAEIAKLPYPPNADDVYMFKRLNYILRGDAGRTTKTSKER